MASDANEALEAALVEAGAPTKWSRTAKGATLAGSGPVAALVNSGSSAKPYADLLLRALPHLAGMEQEMVARALSERGMPRAGPVLAAILGALAEAPDPGRAWAFGNALATISDPATFGTVTELCADTRLGTGRQMLFGLLPRIGTDAAYQVALAGLDDDGVRAHAFEALGRFGRLEALERIRAVATRKGLYEEKAKATAIRRLERAGARRSADA